jgi:AcrR family transcriptional regulator
MERLVLVQTKESTSTEERLLAAAIALFAKNWYGTVSVAAICREAGLSNGVYYRYFDSKEAIFHKILERVLSEIRDTVAAPRGMNQRDRLHSLIQDVVGFSRIHPDLVAVFREGQYRFFEYERRLVAIYTQSLAAVFGREMGLPEYLFAFGGLRFCAIRSALHGVAIDLEGLDDIIGRGLFKGMSFDSNKVFGGTATPLPVALEAPARERLLRAGKRLFGEKGYFNTNIHEITDRAELSVGSFYSYFASKEAYLSELIRMIGHDVRLFIAQNLAAGGVPLNRLERELRGLWLWLVYLSIDKDCYSVVREGEFVVPAAVLDYYGHFAEGYKKNPEGNGEADERTAIEFLLGIAHYLGIESAFDSTPANARAAVEAIAGYLSRGFSDWMG